jgi:hypothetical protein
LDGKSLPAVLVILGGAAFLYGGVVLLAFSLSSYGFGRLVPAPVYLPQPSLSLSDSTLFLAVALVNCLFAVIIMAVGRSLSRTEANPSRFSVSLVLLASVVEAVSFYIASLGNSALSDTLYYLTEFPFGLGAVLPLGFTLSVGGMVSAVAKRAVPKSVGT